MPMLLWLVEIAIIYISNFEKDFNKESTDKALLFLTIVGVVVFVIAIILSILESR